MGKEKDKKQGVLTIFGILIILMVGGVVFYAARSYTSKNNNDPKKITNTITLNYVSNKNELIVYNTATYDVQNGILLDENILLDGDNNVFDFSVTSKISKGTSCNYEIAVSKDEKSTIPDDKIKIYLQKSDNSNYSKPTDLVEPINFTLSNNITLTDNKGMLLDKGVFKKSKAVYYRLKVRVDSSYVSTNNKDFYKVSVNNCLACIINHFVPPKI